MLLYTSDDDNDTVRYRDSDDEAGVHQQSREESLTRCRSIGFVVGPLVAEQDDKPQAGSAFVKLALPYQSMFYVDYDPGRLATKSISVRVE